MRRGIRTQRQLSVDAHVGSRIRLRRMELGMSQIQLGKAIAVTFQQVQKYERGTNRVSVSTLYGLSQALGVPVWFFFDGMPQAVTSKGVSTRAVGTDLLATQQTQELVRAYYSIPGAVRQGLHQLVRSAARSAPDSARSRRHED